MACSSGYVLKQISGAGLIAGVREVAAGNSLLDPPPPSVSLPGFGVR